MLDWYWLISFSGYYDGYSICDLLNMWFFLSLSYFNLFIRSFNILYRFVVIRDFILNFLLI